MSIYGLAKKLRTYILLSLNSKVKRFGKNPHLGKGVVMWALDSIVLGDNFYMGRYSSIECNATIGDGVLISNYVQILGKYDHDYTQIGTHIRSAKEIRNIGFDFRLSDNHVIIEDGVWIGAGSVILSGCIIGRGSIIAAGSVVVRDVSPYSIVGGNPVRKISERFTADEIKRHEQKLYR